MKTKSEWEGKSNSSFQVEKHLILELAFSYHYKATATNVLMK